MKTLLTILLLLFFLTTIQSQRKVNIGIEGGSSLFNGMGLNMDPTLMKNLNLVVVYGEYELYGGLIEINFSNFTVQNKGFTTIGPFLGLRYHKLTKKRQSHFFADLNLSWRDYYPNYVAPPYGGNSDLDYIFMKSIGVEYYSQTFNSHLSIGYESIFFDRISLPIMLGAGLAVHSGQTTQVGIEEGLSDYEVLEFSPIIRIGLRVYVYKINTAVNKY